MKRGKKGNSFLFSGRRNKITRSLFLTAIFVSSEKEEKPGKEREKILPSHSPKKEESPEFLANWPLEFSAPLSDPSSFSPTARPSGPRTVRVIVVMVR